MSLPGFLHAECGKCAREGTNRLARALKKHNLLVNTDRAIPGLFDFEFDGNTFVFGGIMCLDLVECLEYGCVAITLLLCFGPSDTDCMCETCELNTFACYIGQSLIANHL